ncbi:hypothetical protein HPB51_007452 [Rhipicephalus microplus]|uniref:Uncharacterized protein n=1 Tax=Rhipicephalus microplus TaxID=6941 RepID=A0A9J6EYG3_RHIMP|nr:hypothetical protein HPB51_007452 [Rhipicephalus microplus]
MWRIGMIKKSALEIYRTIKQEIAKERIYDNTRGSSLLFEARTGVLRTKTYQAKHEELLRFQLRVLSLITLVLSKVQLPVSSQLAACSHLEPDLWSLLPEALAALLLGSQSCWRDVINMIRDLEESIKILAAEERGTPSTTPSAECRVMAKRSPRTPMRHHQRADSIESSGSSDDEVAEGKVLEWLSEMLALEVPTDVHQLLLSCACRLRFTPEYGSIWTQLLPGPLA